MIRQYFRCTFLADVVLNAAAATEGNNRSLDYVPGSIFLGVTAENYGHFRNLPQARALHGQVVPSRFRSRGSTRPNS